MKRIALLLIAVLCSVAWAEPPVLIKASKLDVSKLPSMFGAPAFTTCPAITSCPYGVLASGAWGNWHVDASGNLLVASGGSPSSPLSTCPASGACPYGLNPSGNYIPLSVDSSGNLLVAVSGGGGNGTVTSVSVTTANGISGTVATPTVTPAITLTLGAITPTSDTPSAASGLSMPAGGALNLGAAGTAASIVLGNATSGTVTLAPVTGALGSVTASFPAATGTVAVSASAPITESAAGAVACATCVTSAAALTSGALVLGGGLQATSTSTAFTASGGTLTVGVVGGTGGTVTLAGSTSGTVSWACSPLTTCTSLSTSAAASVGKIGNINSITTAGSVGVAAVRVAPAAIATGSGTSIGSTSLCTAAVCTIGLYQVNVYLDITTPCTTTGTYFVSLIWTDDGGAHTAVVPLQGTGVTFTSGTTATGVTDSLDLSSATHFAAGNMTLYTTGATTINYSTTAGACGTGGPMVGKMYLSIQTAN